MKRIEVALLAMSWVAGASLVAAAAAEPLAEPETDAIAIELVHGPKITHWATGDIYPRNEVIDGREGWVVVTLLVDSTGKLQDAMVRESSGNPAFERAALRAVQTCTFEPARRNGTPVDATLTFKLTFAMANPAKSATPAFVSDYRKFMKAIQARDKPQADRQLARLAPRNLYEEAFANIGKYYYHVEWGMPGQQREDLNAAIAGEKKQKYLPKDIFVTALFMKFKLEVAASEFGTALKTWDVLEPLADVEMRQNVHKVVREIQAIQASDQATRVSGVIGDRGRWDTWLLRNRFNVVVKDGSISEVKLTCAHKVVSFKFDPEIQYNIGSAKESCEVLLVGRPGTSFEFNQ